MVRPSIRRCELGRGMSKPCLGNRSDINWKKAVHATTAKGRSANFFPVLWCRERITAAIAIIGSRKPAAVLASGVINRRSTRKSLAGGNRKRGGCWVDNASAAKIHQILIGLKDGDIVPLNALAAIADADLNWRMSRIKSYSNQNLMFLSSALISGRWSKTRDWVFVISSCRAS